MFAAFERGPRDFDGPGFDPPQRRDRRLPSLAGQRHAGNVRKRQEIKIYYFIFGRISSHRRNFNSKFLFFVSRKINQTFINLILADTQKSKFTVRVKQIKNSSLKH